MSAPADIIRSEVTLVLSKGEIMTLIGWHNFTKFSVDGGMDDEGHAVYLKVYDAYQRALDWERGPK